MSFICSLFAFSNKFHSSKIFPRVIPRKGMYFLSDRDTDIIFSIMDLSKRENKLSVKNCPHLDYNYYIFLFFVSDYKCDFINGIERGVKKLIHR